MSDDKSKWTEAGKSLRKGSLALAIPTMFVGAPLGVGFIGYWIGKWIWSPKWGFLIGFILGLVIAIRETVRTLRILSKD